jgi:hypothetical protein
LPQAQHPAPAKVVPLPRTRHLSWTAMLLESSHQIVLAIWIGSLVGIASLAIPTLIDGLGDHTQAVRVALELLSRLSFLGCGAGGFLLLTSMLMYLLSLRSARAATGQAAVILVMTVVAIGLEVWLAPAVSGLLRRNPDLLGGGPELSRFRSLLGLHLGLLIVQALLGSALLLMGVRRWYRYVTVHSRRRDYFWWS